MTGGCHYTAGCTNYQDSCKACPQLAEDPHDVASRSLEDQRRLYDAARLTIVGPSRWIAQCALRSRVFCDSDVRVIHSGIEESLFTPGSRHPLRTKLGISPSVRVLLFGADNPFERRKGLSVLASALAQCHDNPGFRCQLSSGEVVIMAFGPSVEGVFPADLPIRFLGYISDDRELVDVYRAADLFILPSLEDNMPNTILEAMSCGIPVVAFDVGGIPDMVTDGLNGRLTEAGNTEQLSKLMLDLINAPQDLEEFGKRARQEVESRFCLTHQAHAYVQLYAELLARSAKVSARADHRASSRVETLFLPLLMRSARCIPRRLARRARRMFQRRAPR
mgnify:CR=1 FL=1